MSQTWNSDLNIIHDLMIKSSCCRFCFERWRKNNMSWGCAVDRDDQEKPHNPVLSWFLHNRLQVLHLSFDLFASFSEFAIPVTFTCLHLLPPGVISQALNHCIALMRGKLMIHSSLLNFQSTNDAVQLPHEHAGPFPFVHLVDDFIKAMSKWARIHFVEWIDATMVCGWES